MQAVFDGVDGHLHAAGQVEFLQHVLHVDLDRAFADVELARDDLVAGAARQALHDLAFARREAMALGLPRRRLRGQAGLAAELFDQLGRHAFGDHRLAAGGATDGGGQRLGVDVLEQVDVYKRQG